MVVSVSLTGTLIPLSTSAGVVLALFSKLLTIMTLVFVWVVFDVTVVTPRIVVTPMVMGPLLPAVRPSDYTSRCRLLTEQTLRRGVGETVLDFMGTTWVPEILIPIPLLGRRLLTLGPVFRLTPTLTNSEPLRQLPQMLKCFEVIRIMVLSLQLAKLPRRLFLFAPNRALSLSVVTVSDPRVPRSTELNDTVENTTGALSIIRGGTLARDPFPPLISTPLGPSLRTAWTLTGLCSGLTEGPAIREVPSRTPL